MELLQIGAAARFSGQGKCLLRAKLFHSHLVKAGHSLDVYLLNSLLTMYIDSFHVVDARQLFDEISNRTDYTWTRMICAYSSAGHPMEAIGLYKHMINNKTSAIPNRIVWSSVIKACGVVGDVGFGREIHQTISKEDIRGDVVLANSLLDMYVKCGSLGDARAVFDGMGSTGNATSWNTLIYGCCKASRLKEAVNLFSRMPERTVVSWNTVIAGFSDQGSFRGLEFLKDMHASGFILDVFTFPCALKLCSYFGLLAVGQEIHCYVVKSGCSNIYHTVSALVDMYSNCNQLEDAIKMFDQFLDGNIWLSGCTALWNSMLSGYVANERNLDALNLLSRFYLFGGCFDSYTFSSALKICINLRSLRFGIETHGLIVAGGFVFDNILGSLLIEFYAELRKIEQAYEIFHRLPKKDDIVWSTMIMGSAKAGLNNSALSLFRDMIILSFKADQHVISAVLKVCSSVASIGNGKQVHTLCIKNSYENEDVTASALINMYSKCGEIKEALKLFYSIPERDVVCWTGIIVGCGQNGLAEEALNLFEEMIKSGSTPNGVTFLGALMACRHAGLVENAQYLFRLMKSDYGIEPHLEHYYCMTDLLGQAGCFKDAEKLISSMPFKPDKTIWSSMLQACESHRNIEGVGMVAKHLLDDFPEDPSVYVMVSNAYAACEMWDSLGAIREQAKKLGTKGAGMSWVEA